MKREEVSVKIKSKLLSITHVKDGGTITLDIYSGELVCGKCGKKWMWNL